MAVVFGVVSVPWTFGFGLVEGLPLWPSFIASASFFAAGGGVGGLRRSLLANILGAAYAAATLLLVDAGAWNLLGLSVLVGVFMLLASLHDLAPRHLYGPGGFLGYAALFSVTPAGTTLFQPGLPGALWATLVSMGIGALIGWGAQVVSLQAVRTADHQAA